MKRHCLFLFCLAGLTILAGCITVNVPGSPGSSATTPATTTVPPTPSSSAATTTFDPTARPVITSFSATPASVTAGFASTLTWSVTGADTVSIDHGVGSVAAAGSRSVLPTATTVYTLTATNSNGSNMAATQIVVSAITPSPAPTPSNSLPVITYFKFDPSSITTGSYSSLSWSISNATSATISPGIGPVSTSGRIPVQPPQTMTFTLTATGPGGSASSTATLKVSDHP